MIIATFGNSVLLAKNIARKLKARHSPLTISQFPDGDLYLKYNIDVKGEVVVIVGSMQPNPTESLIKIIFAAEAAKDLGARKVILVSPYLAFMRQDGRFNPGEAVSSKIVGKLLSDSVDKIITFDPHIHRWKSMKDIFSIPAVKLTTNGLIGKYIQKNYHGEIVTGPDWESSQWAKRIADHIRVPVTIFRKKRFSPWKVQAKMVTPIPIAGKDVIIVDDIISTGHTMMEVAKQLRRMNAKSITAIVVHGMFVGGAISKLKKAGIKRIITTNCIEHPSNEIDVVPLIIKELQQKK